MSKWLSLSFLNVVSFYFWGTRPRWRVRPCSGVVLQIAATSGVRCYLSHKRQEVRQLLCGSLPSIRMCSFGWYPDAEVLLSTVLTLSGLFPLTGLIGTPHSRWSSSTQLVLTRAGGVRAMESSWAAQLIVNRNRRSDRLVLERYFAVSRKRIPEVLLSRPLPRHPFDQMAVLAGSRQRNGRVSTVLIGGPQLRSVWAGQGVSPQKLPYLLPELNLGRELFFRRSNEAIEHF